MSRDRDQRSCWPACLQGGVALLLGLATSPAISGDIPQGWSSLELAASETYAEVYLPPGLDPETPAPMIVYLHGSGAVPSMYRPFVEGAADQSAAVLVLPKSQLVEGWGGDRDRDAIREAIRAVRSEVAIDPGRTSIAGHSSGGAFALVVGLEGRDWSAIFAMSSPHVAIGPAGNPLHQPRVRLYYGDEDPNWISGSGFRLIFELEERELEVEVDLRLGYGHNVWPDETMVEGFLSLTSHRAPVAIRRDVPPFAIR